ncbi:hypothetical protein cypCar_00044275, partial [Cyprinus carpio]
MPARPFFLCLYTVIFLASLVLNSITVYVYFCKATKQSSITIYLKNLAIADLFVCLCLILRIAKYARTSVEIQRIYCNFGAPASYLNMYSSILFMGYIAANRYMKIVRPLETHILQTVRSTCYICIVTWAVLLCSNCAYIAAFVSADKQTSAHSGFDCDSFHTSLLKQIYLTLQIICFPLFLFVLVSLILFYWSNVQKLRQAQRTMPDQPGNAKLSKSKRNMQVLMVVFCICFVPYHLRVSVAKALAVLTWGVMMFFMLPNAILTNQPMPKVFSCMALKGNLGRRWHEISAHFNVGIFWMAFLLMVFCYTSIACHVYRSYKRVQQDSSVVRRRSNRSIFSLLAVFVFCFVPYHVCRVPYTLSQSNKDDFSTFSRFILFQVKEATLFLSALNCDIPIIWRWWTLILLENFGVFSE